MRILNELRARPKTDAKSDNQPSEEVGSTSNKEWVYGTKGVMGKFGWSESTARRKIKGVIKPAVVRTSERKFMVDVDHALELLKKDHRK